MTAAALGAALGATLGAAAAVVAAEAFGVSAFDPGVARVATGVAVAVVLGAAQGASRARLGGGGAGWRVERCMALGAACAGFAALVLARAFTQWVDLSVFGAGPAGRLALVTLPLSQGIAGAVLGGLR